MGAIKINVGSVWTPAVPYINVGGVWKTCTHVYTRVNGVWQDTMVSAPGLLWDNGTTAYFVEDYGTATDQYSTEVVLGYTGVLHYNWQLDGDGMNPSSNLIAVELYSAGAWHVIQNSPNVKANTTGSATVAVTVGDKIRTHVNVYVYGYAKISDLNIWSS